MKPTMDVLRPYIDRMRTMDTCSPYYCPMSGDVECCGDHCGFDVCCNAPDKHIPTQWSTQTIIDDVRNHKNYGGPIAGRSIDVDCDDICTECECVEGPCDCGCDCCLDWDDDDEPRFF